MRQTIVNEHNDIVGHKNRSEITPNDIYQVSALLIENSVWDVLLAERGFLKKNSPWKWGPAVAGTIDEWETYEENIYKEAEEEIGLTGEVFQQERLVRVSGKWNYFCQWFTLVLDRDISTFIKEEWQVETLRWVTQQELSNLIELSPEIFTDNFSTYIKNRLD